MGHGILQKVRDGSGDPPRGSRWVGKSFGRSQTDGKSSGRFGTGRGSFPEVRDESGPLRMSGTGQEVLLKVWNGSGSPRKVRNGSGSPPEGPGRVGGPSQSFGSGSERSEMGQVVLLKVRVWSEDRPKGP